MGLYVVVFKLKAMIDIALNKSVFAVYRPLCIHLSMKSVSILWHTFKGWTYLSIKHIVEPEVVWTLIYCTNLWCEVDEVTVAFNLRYHL